MRKNVAVVIPALEKNRYSKDGDLVKFWDLNLLEWKMAQIKKFIDPGDIYITTPSNKIEKVGRSYGVHVIKRQESSPMAKVIEECAKKANKEIILWTHVTSPFVGSGDFQNMLDKFLKLKGKYDSLVAVSKLREFIIFKNHALNFKMTKVTKRQSIEPVYKITNGCFIAHKDVYLKYKNYFGIKPFLYETNTLSSMEIKDVNDLSVASDLISLFLKRELDV